MIAVLPGRLSPHAIERLDAYLASYRDVFARVDQARSFGLYVRGLIDGDHRKNVESIAALFRECDSASSDLSQSLQHFVTQSPWDANRVIARYRSLVRPRSAGRTWVIHDGILPKKGRHSVGVQRQFARSLGRKVNCQLAVVISEVDRACHPLTARLYLPATWLRDNEARAARSIPDAFRRPRSKVEVALELLDELVAEGPPRSLVAEDGYLSVPGFQDGLSQRGIDLVSSGQATEQKIQYARTGFEHLKDEIGLSHFEGRAWVGWHHHLALVLVAFGFLVQEGKLAYDSADTLPSLPEY